MKKLMTIFAAALFVVSLSSCGGGADACACKKAGEKLMADITAAEGDAEKIKALNEDAKEFSDECAAALKEDADAWATALKECK